MRKLREAAVVAAMVGSVGMIGAGVASAGDLPSVTCTQNAAQTEGAVTQGGADGGQALEGGLSSGGDASTSANQQVCGFGNDENTNNSGDATGGTGGAGTIEVGATEGVIEALLGGLVGG